MFSQSSIKNLRIFCRGLQGYPKNLVKPFDKVPEPIAVFSFSGLKMGISELLQPFIMTYKQLISFTCMMSATFNFSVQIMCANN